MHDCVCDPAIIGYGIGPLLIQGKMESILLSELLINDNGIITTIQQCLHPYT